MFGLMMFGSRRLSMRRQVCDVATGIASNLNCNDDDGVDLRTVVCRVSQRWSARRGKPRLYRCSTHAKVAELADAPDLGSGGATHGGSTPPFRTILSLRRINTIRRIPRSGQRFGPEPLTRQRPRQLRERFSPRLAPTLSTVSNKDSQCAMLGVFLSLGTFDTGAFSSSGRSNPRIVHQSCGRG
jgi:hypothetical protein